MNERTAHSSLVELDFVFFFSLLSKANVDTRIVELTRISKSSTQLSIVCPTSRISENLILDTRDLLSWVQVRKLTFKHTLVRPT